MPKQMAEDMEKSSAPIMSIKLRLMGMIIMKRRKQIMIYLAWLRPSTFHPALP